MRFKCLLTHVHPVSWKGSSDAVYMQYDLPESKTHPSVQGWWLNQTLSDCLY